MPTEIELCLANLPDDLTAFEIGLARDVLSGLDDRQMSNRVRRPISAIVGSLQKLFLKCDVPKTGSTTKDSSAWRRQYFVAKYRGEKLPEEKERVVTPSLSSAFENWPPLGETTKVRCWNRDKLKWENVELSEGEAGQEEYLEYWDEGVLEHLWKKEPKPDHLPSPQDLGRSPTK